MLWCSTPRSLPLLWKLTSYLQDQKADFCFAYASRLVSVRTKITVSKSKYRLKKGMLAKISEGAIMHF